MADTPVSVDGLTVPSTPTPTPPAEQKPTIKPEVKKWERMILFASGAGYIVYLFWAFSLMSILPSPSEALKPLVLLGELSAAVAGLIFLGTGGILFMHIAQSHQPVELRKRALIRLVVFVIPGIIISLVMPYMISQEPAVGIDITQPASSADWIAPVSMSFSVENAMKVLVERGFRPISFKWDLNGDRKVDQETVIPTLTAMYDREGVYTMSVTMIAANGMSRTASKRFVIQTSVFGVSPAIPIVEKPVVFSVAGLVKDPTSITQVQWDFDGDNKVDETEKTPQATYTYYKIGQYKVTAIVDFQNKTQAQYQRTVTVQNPQPLPFPVTLKNEPSHLIGSAPFATLFSIDTKEPIADIQWNFGDNQKGIGLRVAHTYSANGNYPVEVKVRSQSGVTAVLNTAVQVVDALNLPDLTFEGTPQLLGNTIEGEVPLSLNITPKTSASFVQFNWEAPDATEVGSTDTTLQAIYRREGTYTLTLIAQDLNNHVMRRPIKVTVTVPSALVKVRMNPETGLAPLTVNFDASETSIPGDDATGFVWNFGDGTPEITQGASVSHTYTDPRTYTIGLTVQTAGGKSYRTSATVVVRAPVLQACMTRSKENLQAGSSVQFFSDCSAGSPKNYLWDFGDSSQATDENPVHLYTKAGTYTVRLTVDDGTGYKNSTSTTLTVQP